MKKCAVLLLVLAGCGSSHANPTATAAVSGGVRSASTGPATTSPTAGVRGAFPPHLVLTTKDGDIATFSGAGTGLRVLSAVLSPTGTVAVTATWDGGTTDIEWHDVASGEVTGSVNVNGRLNPATVAQDGQLAALFQNGGGFTIVVLADPEHGELRRWTIDSNVVPEAFANAEVGGLPIGVFVLEYLAANTYRVRVIDTVTGELGLPLNLRDKSQTVDEAMTAVSRTAVFEPVHQLLFTLYQDATEGDENVGAFIHTLGLINGVWCLDVPPALGLDAHPGALATSPDGSRLYVASSTGGVAGYVVDDVVDQQLPMPTARATAALPASADRVAIAASDDEVIVALGGRIFRLDPVTLEVRDSFDWDMSVEAMTVLPDRDLIIVGTGRMTLVPPDHRQVLDERPIGDLGDVTRVAVV